MSLRNLYFCVILTFGLVWVVVHGNIVGIIVIGLMWIPMAAFLLFMLVMRFRSGVRKRSGRH
jgi:hypothetical protein